MFSDNSADQNGATYTTTEVFGMSSKFNAVGTYVGTY